MHAHFHVACCIYTACCTLHVARCTLHVARCMLHAACCTLHVARCTLHVARCMMHVARCTMHVARCIVRCLVRVGRAGHRRRQLFAELDELGQRHHLCNGKRCSRRELGCDAQLTTQTTQGGIVICAFESHRRCVRSGTCSHLEDRTVRRGSHQTAQRRHGRVRQPRLRMHAYSCV